MDWGPPATSNEDLSRGRRDPSPASLTLAMPTCIPPRRARVVPILLALTCAAAGPVRAQPPSPIVASGKGVLEKLSPTDGESLSLEIQMRNGTAGPVRVTRAESFLACQGGWMNSLGETIAKEGKFFGNDPVLTPGEYSFEFAYRHSTPISHYLLALQLTRPGHPSHDYLLQVPFVRRGFAAPQPLRVASPAFVALQEPIEVFKLATGEVWLPIIGQVVNTSGKPLTLKTWKIRVKDSAGKATLDRDLSKVFRVEGSTQSINEFLFAFVLPDGFRKGTLQIDAEADLGGGRRVSLARTAEVERIEPHPVRSPVEGRWHWGNGPGELQFHTHYHFPEQRYAYDLRMLGGARRATFSGDSGKNESYFCWDKPIHCAEDGTVTTVIDDVPDNFGRKANPANKAGRNACVLVEHAGNRFSGYYHLRQGSATVKVGQRVKAGDVLGRVGNAGISSEPHLHFDTMGYDRTGRLRNIPVRIEGLKSPDGKPADGGVPKGGVEYVAGAGK